MKKKNNNIQVSVSSIYLEDHSDPSEDSFLWAYQVKIKNNGMNTVKLIRRHWKIIDSNGIAVIDQDSKEIIKYLLVGQRVWQLFFTPDQQTLISTNGVSNDVSFIDVKKLKVTKSVKVGRFPWGVVIAPDK